MISDSPTSGRDVARMSMGRSREDARLGLEEIFALDGDSREMGGSLTGVWGE